MKTMLKWIFGIMVFFWVIGWLSGLKANDSDSTPKPSNAITIKKSEIVGWPFTVEEGRLWCDNGNILFLAGGILYGINGSGATYVKNKGGHPIKDICAIDEKQKRELLKLGLSDKQSDSYLSISPILEMGSKLCK